MDVVTKRQWDDLFRKLKWADGNWQELMFHSVQRFAEEYARALGKSDYLHLIHVQAGPDSYWGVSLEPEPFEAKLSDVSEKLLYYLVREPEKDPVIAEVPFVFDRVPKVPERDDLFLLRDSTADERTEWSMRNDALLAKQSLTPVPITEVVRVQEDMRYNMLRGEFGIGDHRSDVSWRKALRAVKKKGKGVASELEKSLHGMKLPKVGNFEERSKEWLKDNEHTVLILVGG